MCLHQWMSALISKGVAVALVLVFAGASIAFVREDGGSRAAAQTPAKLEATVFSYDGHDFIRTNTTLVTKEGKSAVHTKLEHDTPAYNALMKKRSYSGDATIFGRKYDAKYAPLTGDDGRLVGALFVGVPE